MFLFIPFYPVLDLHITSCLGLKENEQEAIKGDEKEYKLSRTLGNYFLNAWHPDARVNNALSHSNTEEEGL